MLRVLVLLSAGRHPASGRTRRAGRDARALEMALSLPGPVDILAVHAGSPDEPALRDYLGMGLEALTVLDLPPGADPVPPLASFAQQAAPQIVLAGSQAEAGEDSGMVPYLIAEALGATTVRDVTGLDVTGLDVTGAGNDAPHARLVQALPRGRRQETVCPLPVVAGVSLSAPPPRAPAFVRARAGRIYVQAARQVADDFLAACEIRPYRRRAMQPLPSGSARDRLKAATEAQAGEGRALQNLSPEAAAMEIRDYLVARGLLRPPQA